MKEKSPKEKEAQGVEKGNENKILEDIGLVKRFHR